MIIINAMKSIIGKKYIPFDNSWSVNVTIAGDYPLKNKQSYLAGSIGLGLASKIVTIVSEPFQCNVNTFGCKNPKGIETMIMVDYNEQTHMVMFDKSQIIK